MIGKKIAIILLVGLLFYSCTNDEDRLQKEGEAVNLDLKLSPRSANMNVRLLVTDTSNGHVLINEYPAQIQTDGKYKLDLKIGIFDFNIIANEPDRLTPILNSVRTQTELSSAIIQFGELPKTEDTFGTNETNIPAIKKITAGVRRVPGKEKEENPPGEVTLDNGKTWSSDLQVELERLAAKLSLNLRKNTPESNEVVSIKKVSISKVPTFSYLLPKSYSGTDFTSLNPFINTTGLLFDKNIDDPDKDDNYVTIFENLILPEYILADPKDKNNSVLIRIEATYNNEKNVSYYIRPKNSATEDDFTLERNTHYIINGTITTDGELDYMPEVKYQVADWEDANTGITFAEESAIMFTGDWADNTSIDKNNPNNILVKEKEYVEFNFMLSHPEGATWSATITNPIDFAFDYIGEGVSEGRVGKNYKIRIKPRREDIHNTLKTEFYITVNNNQKYIELDLPNEITGTGNRYTITQIPL